MTNVDPDLVLYVDSASSFLMSRLGVDFPEKKILEIAELIGIPVFGVGTRKMFKRDEFEEKFSEYIKKSSEAEKTKKSNRVSGALIYNEKVDSLFSYLCYLLKKGAFDVAEAHTFMLHFDEKLLGNTTVNQLEAFIVARSERNKKCIEGGKSASTELDKLLSKKSKSKKGSDKSKRDVIVKSVSGTLGPASQDDAPTQ